jgi:hypothetical protein
MTVPGIGPITALWRPLRWASPIGDKSFLSCRAITTASVPIAALAKTLGLKAAQ